MDVGAVKAPRFGGAKHAMDYDNRSLDVSVNETSVCIVDDTGRIVRVIGPIGERVISYFGDFGSLDGRISDALEGGFLLDLDLSRARREKFASQLVWLQKSQKNAVIDCRQRKRIIPKNPH